MQKLSSQINLYLFSFISVIIVYGFALTNFTLTMDSESPVVSSYSMHLGRWGTNLVRYHMFKGLYPYYTLLFGLLFLSLTAVEITKILKLENVYKYIFILLFLSFPQHAYHFAFTMQADAIGLGYFISVLAVSYYVNLEKRKNSLYFFKIIIIIVLLTTTIAIYQTLIYIPTIVYAIWFFQKLNEDNIDIKKLWKNVIYFIVILLVSVILYVLSVKILFPTDINGGYFDSYMSEGDNIFLSFYTLLKNNYLGKFFYGEKLFILVLIGMILSVYFFVKEKKFVWLKLLTFIFLFIYPFTFALLTKEAKNPPRLFVGTTLIFAFVIIYTISKVKLKNELNILFIGLVIYLTNAFYINNLFTTTNKIFKRDLVLAEKIVNRIHTDIPNLDLTKNTVYFYGKPTQALGKNQLLNYSDVFSVSILREGGGSNYRISDFFRFNNLADLKIVDNLEEFNKFIDSIPSMPIFPATGSIKKIDNTIVIKLGNTKGQNLSFEKETKTNFEIKKNIEIKPFDNSISENSAIQGNVDEMKFEDNNLHISGWILSEGVPSYSNKVSIYLFNKANSFVIETNKSLRTDVTEFFSDGKDYDSCGFLADINLNSLPKGIYEIRIILSDNSLNIDGYKKFDKKIEIK